MPVAVAHVLELRHADRGRSSGSRSGSPDARSWSACIGRRTEMVYLLSHVTHSWLSLSQLRPSGARHRVLCRLPGKRTRGRRTTSKPSYCTVQDGAVSAVVLCILVQLSGILVDGRPFCWRPPHAQPLLSVHGVVFLEPLVDPGMKGWLIGVLLRCADISAHVSVSLCRPATRTASDREQASQTSFDR